MIAAPQRIRIELWEEGPRFTLRPAAPFSQTRPGRRPARQRAAGMARTFNRIQGFPRLWVVLLFLNLHFTQAQPTNSSAPQDHPRGGPVELSSFKIISERNIFNANRSSRSVRTNGPGQKPAQVESFSLVGTLISDKGIFAFFDGSSSGYKKALKAGEGIASYTIKEINSAGVKLETGGKETDLGVGMQMRRQDEGPWLVVTEPGSYASVPRPPAAGESEDAASNGEVSDVLKKLMQKREQELNK